MCKKNYDWKRVRFSSYRSPNFKTW